MRNVARRFAFVKAILLLAVVPGALSQTNRLAPPNAVVVERPREGLGKVKTTSTGRKIFLMDRYARWVEQGVGQDGQPTLIFYETPLSSPGAAPIAMEMPLTATDRLMATSPDRLSEILAAELKNTQQEMVEGLKNLPQTTKEATYNGIRYSWQALLDGTGYVKKNALPFYTMKPVDFGWESLVFYVGVGALVTPDWFKEQWGDGGNNPVALSSHNSHHFSLLGQLGIYLFITHAKIGSHWVNKTFLKKFPFLAPALGMSLGGFVQSWASQLLEDPNLKICVDYIRRDMAGLPLKDPNAGKVACQQSFEHFVVHRKIWETAPNLVSMVAGATAQNYLQFKIAQKMVQTGANIAKADRAVWLGMTLERAAKYVNPSEMFAAYRAKDLASLPLRGLLKFRGASAAHLAIFVGLDMLMTPPLVRAWKGYLNTNEIAATSTSIWQESLRQNQVGWSGVNEDFTRSVTKFATSMSAYRAVVLEPVYESYGNWMLKLNQAVGWYRATEMFYGRMVEEIRKLYNVALPDFLKPLSFRASMLDVKQLGVEDEMASLNRYNFPVGMERNQIESLIGVVKSFKIIKKLPVYQKLFPKDQELIEKVLEKLDPKGIVTDILNIRYPGLLASSNIKVEGTEMEDLYITEEQGAEIFTRLYQERQSLSEGVKLIKDAALEYERQDKSGGGSYSNIDFRVLIKETYNFLGRPKILQAAAGEAFIKGLQDRQFFKGLLENIQIPDASKRGHGSDLPKATAEFLIYQMVCGPKVLNNESFIDDGVSSPMAFLPPRITDPRDELSWKCDQYRQVTDRPRDIFRDDFIYFDENRKRVEESSWLNYVKFNIPANILGPVAQLQSDSENLRKKFGNKVRTKEDNDAALALDKDPRKSFNAWWETSIDPAVKAGFQDYSLRYNEIVLNLVKTLKQDEFYISNTTQAASSGPLLSSMQEIKFFTMLLGEMYKSKLRLLNIPTPANLYSTSNQCSFSDQNKAVRDYQEQVKLSQLTPIAQGDFAYLSVPEPIPPVLRILKDVEYLDLQSMMDVLSGKSKRACGRNLAFQDELISEYRKLLALFDQFESIEVSISGRKRQFLLSRTDNDKFEAAAKSFTQVVEKIEKIFEIPNENPFAEALQAAAKAGKLPPANKGKPKKDIYAEDDEASPSKFKYTDAELQLLRLIFGHLPNLAMEMAQYGRIANMADFENMKKSDVMSSDAVKLVGDSDKKAKDAKNSTGVKTK